jgi:signal transduction histidine kinase/ActR/RegA family two-component response regulator
MKIRTRAFLLGLLPTLFLALVLSAYHVYSRLGELDATVRQQGMALARHLATAAEYGVLSGNRRALGSLLDEALREPGAKSAVVILPDRTRIARGDPHIELPAPHKLGQWQAGKRLWFMHPVVLGKGGERDLFFDDTISTSETLAWVAVGIDADQTRVLARRLLLTSLVITLLGLALAILLINRLALTGLQPLMEIIDTVRNVSAGDFGRRLRVSAHSPELRQLQAMVNRMSESLRSYQQDMEERVRSMTAELEFKKREAEQANLAKSKFLAAASHDLRQPMHAIGLYVESLKPQMQGRAAEETLNKIERSIASMVELFNAILDVTKLDAGVVQPNVAPLRIRRFLLDLADEFAAETDHKGLSLRVRAADVWANTDEILLERILRNLLSNAVRHTAKGGILLAARRCRGRLRLQVWDTGSGISPEHQPRIFEEFYQADTDKADARQGLGLGLAIVSRLARLLAYPLQLHSQPGRGTVISLDLPLVENPAASLDPADAGDRAPLSGRALVIDDDPLVRDALGELLRQWGMEVELAANLRQARESLGNVPDVVLADYQLPNGETGLMAAQDIRSGFGRVIPVALITGDTRTETIRALRLAGFPVLHKPVRVPQLRSLLATMLRDGKSSRSAP